MLADRLCKTLIELVSIPSTTGHEEHIRNYLEQRLAAPGFTTQVDAIGNLVATLAGEGKPLLLNAHMDRVPPGLGQQPILRDGILYSDGTTNLGADDAAGIAIILEVLTRVVEEHLPHPPLVVVFTVQEEAGLCGATKFDPAPYHVTDGIVFDNAFEAGVVVSKGAAYEAFDVPISEDAPLLQSYRAVLAQRGAEVQIRPTFICSDTSGFRPQTKAFTISTGVVNEHSVEEYVPLAQLEQVVQDTLTVLEMLREQ